MWSDQWIAPEEHFKQLLSAQPHLRSIENDLTAFLPSGGHPQYGRESLLHHDDAQANTGPENDETGKSARRITDPR
jgi:hypothetical protein